jgi:hypothetical protein
MTKRRTTGDDHDEDDDASRRWWALPGCSGLGYMRVTSQHGGCPGGRGLLEQAGKMGGSVGTVGQLGSAIVDMRITSPGPEKSRYVENGAALTGK